MRLDRRPTSATKTLLLDLESIAKSLLPLLLTRLLAVVAAEEVAEVAGRMNEAEAILAATWVAPQVRPPTSLGIVPLSSLYLRAINTILKRLILSCIICRACWSNTAAVDETAIFPCVPY